MLIFVGDGKELKEMKIKKGGRLFLKDILTRVFVVVFILYLCENGHVQEEKFNYLDFNSWKLTPGVWEYKDGKLSGTGKDDFNEYFVETQEKFKDFVLECEIKISILGGEKKGGTPSVGILLRDKKIRLTFWDKGLDLLKARLDFSPGGVVKREVIPDALNKWTDIEIKLRGRYIKIKFDGKVWYEEYLPLKTFTGKGNISFYVRGKSKCDIEKIKISEIKSEIKTELERLEEVKSSIETGEKLITSFENNVGGWPVEYYKGGNTTICELSSRKKTHGQYSLKLIWKTKNKEVKCWPGFRWRFKSPQDWSKYEYLKLDVYPVEKVYPVVFSIRPGYETSLSREIHNLKANQWNTLIIDLSEIKEVKNIVRMDFHLGAHWFGIPEEVIMYVDNIRLITLTEN
ncbi:DUF1080 domain-containing protein [bacterium]|nr:DUF1080 domain-containing protein [bacterium]